MEFKSIPHEFHIQFISGLLNTTSVFFLSALLGTIVGMTIAIMNVSQDARGSNIAVAYTYPSEQAFDYPHPLQTRLHPMNRL
ncbi:ABC-type amino acid transport system permease subunit [Rhizobium leguminosarum]